MQQGMTPKEAVQLAREKLGGDVPASELAGYIQEVFGLTITPLMVRVLLGTLLEREALDRSGQQVREQIDRWKVENPLEAKKMAAIAKRREAVARRKAEARGASASADSQPAERATVALPEGGTGA